MVYLCKVIDGIEVPVTPLEPLKHGENMAVDFSMNIRDNGIDEVTFKIADVASSTSLEIGKLYTTYLDAARTLPLPCNFLLKGDYIIYDNHFVRWHECTGISANDLLYRVWIYAELRNVRIRDVLIHCIEKTRIKVPSISNDYSQIEDLDFTFTTYRKQRKYLGEILQELRNQGFWICFDHKFRVVLKNKETTAPIKCDLFRSTIDGRLGILKGSKAGYQLPDNPTTSLYLLGGLAETGVPLTTVFTGTGDPVTGNKFSLTGDVNIDSNFVLETFESLELEGITGRSETGTGWDQRYRVYEDALKPVEGLETQIKFELIKRTGQTILLGLGDGVNFSPASLNAGFLIKNQELLIIANKQQIPTGINLKAYEEKLVTGFNASGSVITLENTENLNIGDIISVVGINSTFSIENSKIIGISGNTITLDRACTLGVLNPTVKLRRVWQYVLKWQILSTGRIEFILQEENLPSQSLGVFSFSAPTNGFISLYTNLTGTEIEKIDSGIWEIDNVALDHWFLDKAQHFTLWNKTTGKKVTTCSADQYETVFADAIIKKEEENGKDVVFVEFASPSLTPTVLYTGTSNNRIAVVLRDDLLYSDLKVGMRCLINTQEYFITAVYNSQGLSNDWIEVSPALPSPPLEKTPIYVNTTIPAVGQVYEARYIESIRLSVRSCASTSCSSQYGYREALLEVQEVGSLTELSQLGLSLIEDECLPKINGNLGFKVSSLCPKGRIFGAEFILPYFELPQVGSYLEISDLERGILGERAMIQAISIQSEEQGNFTYLNIGYDFGMPRLDVAQRLVLLLQKYGIDKDEANEDEFNNAPCLLRDTLTFEEDLTIAESDGYDFISGFYVLNYSDSKDWVLPTETFTIIENDFPNFAGYSSGVPELMSGRD